MGFFGYADGTDPASYTGWKTQEGGDQTFDRDAWAVDKPTYEVVGETTRPDARTEVIFFRSGALRQQWDDEKGIESLNPHMKEYYKKHPEDLELDLYMIKEVFPAFMKDNNEYGEKFIISEAWSNAMGAVWPDAVSEPPEISDFPQPDRHGNVRQPYSLKNETKTAELIKKVSHQFGATLVGITKLNPDWVYSYPKHGRGFEDDKPLEVPKHWKYAVVIGTPMSWDPMMSNPNYGTSFDAYSNSRIVAHRLAAFIKELGYAARQHTPGTDYDLMVPPIAVDAGLGEQGRHSVLITPELGSNIRLAVITTNIPMAVDKPIDFGVQDFCKHCKICAENCPSGAITTGDKEDVNGYKRYQLNISKCYNFWFSNLGNIGCRLCVTTCPYSRKGNWLHKSALTVSANDPTGIVDQGLTALQKEFYPGPDPEEYYIPSLGGKNASFREPPWWLKTDDFIDLKGGK